MWSEYEPGPPILYGWGAFDRIDEWLSEGDIFLVMGGRSSDRLGVEEAVRANAHGAVSVFRGVEPNPSSDTVEKGAEQLRSSAADCILAVGGGSVMDAAKFMAVIAHRGGKVIDYLTDKRTPAGFGIPLTAVPTTPGTSSEITPFSIVTVPELNNKVGLRHPSIYPDRAVVDPKLTLSLPPEQTAATGLDILSHSFESFWAKRSNRITRELCLTAVRHVKEHLLGAYRDGSKREHREGISLASIFAGHGFSNTGTTICHAISYPITMDTGLDHGKACALSLGPTFDLLWEKGERDIKKLSEAFGSTPDTLSEDIKELIEQLDAPHGLAQVERKDWIERIMETEYTGFRKNFRVDLTEDDVSSIIESM
ncbi:MAG: phosphonoacetaldehyde reductase [Thermoplasmatota archaeon]